MWQLHVSPGLEAGALPGHRKGCLGLAPKGFEEKYKEGH